MTNKKPKLEKNNDNEPKKISWFDIIVNALAIIIGLGLIAGAIAIMITQHQIWNYNLINSGEHIKFGFIIFGLAVMIILGLISSIGIPVATYKIRKGTIE